MITTVRNWEDADRALVEVAGLRRDLKTCTVERDEAIERAKEHYGRKAKPVEDHLGQLEEVLQNFTVEHTDELDGRSRALNHGRVGLLLVKAMRVRNIKNAVAWLLEAKKLAYLHVKHDLNKEAPRDAPDEVLKACGAKVKSRDQFWYEVDGERHAVED